MADLRALLEDLGYEDVRTLLQSGNAVFDRPAQAARDGGAPRSSRPSRSGSAWRSAWWCARRKEMADIVAANPLADVATNGAKQHVSSSRRSPIAPRWRRSPILAPEVFAVRGREIHVWCREACRAAS